MRKCPWRPVVTGKLMPELRRPHLRPDNLALPEDDAPGGPNLVRAEESERAQKLLKITGALADAVSTEQVLQAVVDSVADAVNASSAGLWLLSEDGRTVTLARARGYHEGARTRFEALPLDLT